VHVDASRIALVVDDDDRADPTNLLSAVCTYADAAHMTPPLVRAHGTIGEVRVLVTNKVAADRVDRKNAKPKYDACSLQERERNMRVTRRNANMMSRFATYRNFAIPHINDIRATRAAIAIRRLA
jgi:muconolactone delta-isomerase